MQSTVSASLDVAVNVDVSVDVNVNVASSMSAALMLSVEKSTISVRHINQLKNLKQQHFYIFIGAEHLLLLRLHHPTCYLFVHNKFVGQAQGSRRCGWGAGRGAIDASLGRGCVGVADG